MKLKNLKGFPEKKSCEIWCDTFLGGHSCNCGMEGLNKAIDQIGNIEVELDVGKVQEKIVKWFEVQQEFNYFHKYDNGDRAEIDGEFPLIELAQAIADNFKEIVK